MKNTIVSFSQKIFELEKIFSWKIFFPISIQNFPRIPKITLRNSCDEYKGPKNEKTLFLCIKSTDPTSGQPQLGDSFV